MASLPDVDDDDDDVLVIHGDGADRGGDAGEDVSADMRSVPGVLPYLPTTTAGASAPPARPPALSFAGGAAPTADPSSSSSAYPTSQQPESTHSTTDDNAPKRRGLQLERPYRDRMFTLLYVLAAGVVLLSGVSIAVTTKPMLDPVTGGLAYLLHQAIQGSMGVLCLVIVAECALAAAWLATMRYSAKLCTWLTLFMIPLQLLMFGAWALRVQSSATLVSFGAVSIGAGVGALALGVVLAYRIDSTIVILQLASTVLLENSAILLVAAGASLTFALVTLGWLYLYASLLLLGYTVDADPSWWALYPGSWWAQMFYYFFFFWTLALISHIQLSTVAGSTFYWYYHRDEARNTRPLTVSGPTVDALHRALTTSFGTLCMSGLVLAIARLMRLILDRMLSSTNRENAWWARMLTSCGGFIERIVMQVSSFVVIYNALTGDSFCTSSRDMTGVLRRNLLDRFVVDMVAHMILYIWTISVAGLCALGVYTYVAEIALSPHSWVPTLLSFLITFGIMRFFVALLLDVVDTLFVCYALDCDAGVVGRLTPGDRNLVVHDIMSSSLTMDSKPLRDSTLDAGEVHL